MIASRYSIVFNYPVEGTELKVPLIAEVEEHQTYYIVRNIKKADDRSGSILPDIKIKKVKGHWVHCDSEKETNLSVEVGKVIDGRECQAVQDISAKPY